MDMQEKRDWLIGLLKTSDVKVVFNKSDGSERTMLCTLQPDVIIPYEKKTDRVVTPNLNTVRVWDLEEDSWRSFRVDSVISVMPQGV